MSEPENGRPPFPAQYIEHLLMKLLAGLIEAFESWPDRTSASDQRARYIMALRSIGAFLEGVDGSRSLEMPLYELARALHDLGDSGQVEDFLKPVQVANRRRDSSKIWCDRAKAAYAVDMLVAAGQSKREAIQHLVRKHRLVIQRMASKKSNNLATTLDGWHQKFSTGDVENDLARDIYAVGREELERIRSCVAEADLHPKIGALLRGLFKES